MTLTTRLCWFFLTMLGLVLAGFSTTLFFLASAHLHREAEERLEAAMNTLVAAAEVGPDGVEWEPAERWLTFRTGAGGDQVVWLVSDDQGRLVDRSAQPAAADLPAEASSSLGNSDRPNQRLDWQGERWQFSRRWIQTPPGNRPPPESSQPGPANEPTKHAALAITAGISLEPVHSKLRLLAGVLSGLSVVVWLVALFLGRAVSRRALRPVTSMATSARAMDAADLGQRLPTASTEDELEDLSRAFNSLLDRVQESFERQKRFTGDASHQLRTPLAAILGQLEVALRRDRPPEEYQRVLKTVQLEALHLRRIVESLLFLARADAEARLPDLETVELKGFLAGHLRTWASHERAADITLDGQDAPVVRVAVQPALLGEVVDILLDNSCKYSQAGTPIQVRIGLEGHAASLTVEDRGCGISEEDLPHLFTPFFRSVDSRRRGIEGLGLGLSIAKRLAAAFGGELHVSSTVGRGSSFEVTLPARTAE